MTITCGDGAPHSKALIQCRERILWIMAHLDLVEISTASFMGKECAFICTKLPPELDTMEGRGVAVLFAMFDETLAEFFAAGGFAAEEIGKEKQKPC